MENSGSNDTVSFTNVAVNGNTAATYAGGMYVENSGSPATFTFTGGSIDDNSASNTSSGYAGGVYVENSGDPSTATFSGGSISGNSAYVRCGRLRQFGHPRQHHQHLHPGDHRRKHRQ